ncbi:uncharacterized protein LOC114828121 [Galendromus occidentalis]|uniref:Uncharacterized protein LOC114828121 n=1 Tax=Galendromus occidentalis TaxID=34638 RepID=A0AAJ7SDV5_9ACAR|nr:uncharacterized protein LOC114828121 [Galendromus occidentalis]
MECFEHLKLILVPDRGSKGCAIRLTTTSARLSKFFHAFETGNPVPVRFRHWTGTPGNSRSVARGTGANGCGQFYKKLYARKQCYMNDMECWCVNPKTGLMIEGTKIGDFESDFLDCNPTKPEL